MQTAASLSLARRFLRSRSLARSTAPMFVVAALIVGMYVTLSAFTLSGEQVADRDLGRFSARADLGTAVSLPVGETPLTYGLAAGAREAGARDATVALMSFDVRPDTVAGLIIYWEHDWASQPFPDRYTLTAGRWPSVAGEVVVTEPLRDKVGPADSLPVFSGNEQFQIVGVAHDRFGSSSRLLAAPGTWASFGPATRRNFSTVLAGPSLYWIGGDQQQVVEAVAAAASAALTGDVPPSALAAQISETTTTRDRELARGRTSWTERLPIAYSIPSLALPLLSVLTVFGLNGRRLRKSIRVLRSVGVGGVHAAGGVALATGIWVMLSTALGLFAGIGLGLLSRPIVSAVLAQPISPFPGVGGPVIRTLAITASACLLATVVLHVSQRQAPALAESPKPRNLSPRARPTARSMRQAVAVVASFAILAQIATLDTVPEAMLLAGTIGVLLLSFTPEFVTVAVRSLPANRPRVRLGRQQLINDQERAVAGVAVLATVLGAPLGMLTLLATLISTAEGQEVPSVAPHQMVLSARSGEAFPPQPAVVDAVTSSVQFSQPGIQLGYLRTDDTRVSVQGLGAGEVLAVETVEELARLNNGPLEDADIRTLRQGGMLVWHDQGSHGILVHKDLETDRALTTSEPIVATQARLHPVLESSVNAVLLRSAARSRGLPITDGAIVFTGVSDAQASAAQQAVRRAGLDSEQVEVYRPPDPVSVPPVFYTAVVGLGLIVLLTTMSVARSQVITLRGYLGQLISIGLSPRWARQVLMLQTTVVVALSSVLALLLAIPPVMIAVWRLPEFALSVPWPWLGLVIGSFYAAAVGATLLSSRRLRPADRFTA